MAPPDAGAAGAAVVEGGGEAGVVAVAVAARLAGADVVLGGGGGELVDEEGAVALGLFELPQPLINKRSRKKLALGDLKERRNAVDICRKDLGTRWDRTADIHG